MLNTNGTRPWCRLVVLAALCTIPAAPGLAQQPEESAEGLEAAARRAAWQKEENLSRSARRILHMRWGGTARGVARWRDDHWELKQKNGWTALEPGSVVRAVKEAEVLRDRKRRAKEIEKSGDLEARVAFAEWMIDEGLARPEALAELDRVLDASPHHAGALGLLRRRKPIAVPSLEVSVDGLEDARRRLFDWAKDSPDTGRELAILELEKLEDREALREALMSDLGSNLLRRRSFAAHALGRLFPGEEVQRLIQHAVLDSSTEVRRYAAQALHTADNPVLVVPVVRALNSRYPRIRAQAAEALGFMGYAAAVEPLMTYLTSTSQPGGAGRVPHSNIFVGRQFAYIQDFDVEVATFQAVADPQINVLLEGSVLDAGVVGVVEYGYATEMRAARGSLGRLTNENPGRTARAWKNWWAEHGVEWKQNVPAAKGEERDG